MTDSQPVRRSDRQSASKTANKTASNKDSQTTYEAFLVVANGKYPINRENVKKNTFLSLKLTY